MQVPNGDIWCGRYVEGSHYIKGVDTLMNYYNVKPYFMIRFQYLGGGNFNIEIYNEYGVEIEYPLLCENQNHQHDRQKTTLIDKTFSEVDLEKLDVIFHYNVVENFARECEIKVNLKCTASEENDKVIFIIFVNFSTELVLKIGYSSIMLQNLLCRFVARIFVKKLGLPTDVHSLNIGFSLCNWNIKLRSTNNKLYFFKGWKSFVQESGLRDGDLCVIHQSKSSFYWKVAVFERDELEKWSANSSKDMTFRINYCFCNSAIIYNLLLF